MVDRSIRVPQLPPEVWIDIFLRLPILFIQPLRCVCRAWRHLLTDPRFAANHWQRSERLPILLYHDYYRPYGFQRTRDVKLVQLDRVHLHVRFPALSSLGAFLRQELIPLASCNGILCLRYVRESTNGIVYFVGNPLLNDFIPVTGYMVDASRRFSGFGFAPRTHLYKIVQFSKDQSGNDRIDICRVRGCDAGAGYGKFSRVCITHLRHSFKIPELVGQYLKGAIFWLVRGDDGVVFISRFDVDSEEFERLPAPDSPDFQLDRIAEYPIHSKLCLGASGGYLYICANLHHEKIDFWVMEESSWTKKFVILCPVVQNLTGQVLNQRHVEVLNYGAIRAGGGEVMLLRWNRVFSCDTGGKHCRMIDIEEVDRDKAFSYIPSFITVRTAARLEINE